MITKKAGWGLALLCLVAVLIRVWNLDWGLPEVYESAKPLHIARGFWGEAPQSVTLRPNSYLIPSLSPYLLFVEQVFRYFALSLAGQVDSLNDFRQLLDQDWGRSVFHGRWLHAVLSGLLVSPVFFLGRRLGGAWGGWFAAIFIILVPQSVLAGRMVTPDALFLLLASLALVNATAMAQEGKRTSYLWCAFFSGCALSTSYAGGFLLVAYVTGHGVAGWRRRQSPLETLSHLPFWEGAAVFGVAVIMTMPYALLDFQKVLSDMQQAKVQLGLEHLGSEGVLFWEHLLEFLTKAWTIPLGLAGVTGGVCLLWRKETRAAALPGVFLVVFVVIVLGLWGSRSVHPLLVILPVLVAWGASLSGTFRFSKRPQVAAALAVGLLVAPAPAVRSWNLIQAGGREDTRQSARIWLEENLDTGTTILTERYGPDLSQSFNVLVAPFNSVSPHIYDAAYTLELYSTLDYIVLSSKIFDRYRGAPNQYPQQNYFYGHLTRGYTLVQTFESPQYVGPEIRIFKKLEKSGLHDLTSLPRSFFEDLGGNKNIAEYFSQLGVLLAKSGQEKLAFHILQEAVGMDPESPGPWSNLGSVQLTHSRIDEALFSFRKARDLDPDNARVHYNLGVLHQKNAEWSQAEGEFARAVELDPSMEQGFLSLARALIQAERYARARLVLREFLHRFPRSTRRQQADTALSTLANMGPGKP